MNVEPATSDAEDQRLRERAFELMRILPSRSACATRLKAEGFSPELVDAVVSELFTLRKTVASNRMQDLEDQIRILIQVLDKNTEISPRDLDAFHNAAREFAPRLRRDMTGDRAIILGFPLVMIALIAFCIVYPQSFLVTALLTLKYSCIQVLVIGAFLPAFYQFTHGCRRRIRAKRRFSELRALAARMNWTDIK
ncbi:MAG TPA: hypothetical protein VKX17_14900 [Planctomycetota bacterium]|nr:hypothetical protein [Planctomycetota bacterium]